MNASPLSSLRQTLYSLRGLLCSIAAMAICLALASTASAASVKASKYSGDYFPQNVGLVNYLCGGSWGAVERNTDGGRDQWAWSTCYKGRAYSFGGRKTTSYYTSNAAYGAWGWQVNSGVVAYWCNSIRPGAQLLQLGVTTDAGAVTILHAACKY